MESPKTDPSAEQDFKLTVSKRKRKGSNNLEIEEQENEIEMMTEEGEDETKKLKFPPVSGEKLSVN